MGIIYISFYLFSLNSFSFLQFHEFPFFFSSNRFFKKSFFLLGLLRFCNKMWMQLLLKIQNEIWKILIWFTYEEPAGIALTKDIHLQILNCFEDLAGFVELRQVHYFCVRMFGELKVYIHFLNFLNNFFSPFVSNAPFFYPLKT